MAETIREVAVVGAGTMGTWIAAETVGGGYSVRLFDNAGQALERARSAHEGMGVAGPAYMSSLGEAVSGADLVIETIVEDPQAKGRLFAELGAMCRPEAILTTNTSFLLLEDFAKNVPGQERLAHLHFLRPRSAVEIMPGPRTSEATLDALAEFARGIGEEPIPIRKPSRGYCLGPIMTTAMDSALTLVAGGVADPTDVDRAFAKVLGAASGPFGMLDAIGLDVALRIREARLEREPANTALRAAVAVLRERVEAGHLGTKSGRGFFEYGGERA